MKDIRKILNYLDINIKKYIIIIMDFVDKVFVINLKNRVDRKKEIIKELEKVKITDYEIFSVEKPTIEELNKWNPNFIKEKILSERLGAFGCLRSHFEIIREAKKRKYKNILILEDDAEFKENFNFKDINEQYNLIKNNFGLLYISSSINRKNKINNKIVKVILATTTCAYIINEKLINFICDYDWTKIDDEIDVWYYRVIQKKFNCYAFSPILIKQRNSYSDIQNKIVNYKLRE